MKEYAGMRFGAFAAVVVGVLVLGWMLSRGGDVVPALSEQADARTVGAPGESSVVGSQEPATTNGSRVEMLQEDLRIAGKVVDVGGAAVSDAVVTLTLLDGSVVETATEVGERGEFEFAGLVARLYRVTAKGASGQCERLVAAPDANVECVLPVGSGPMVALRVQVLDRRGQSVPDAAVEVVGKFQPAGDRRGVSDQDGICLILGPMCSSAAISVRAPDGRVGFAVHVSHRPTTTQVVVASGGMLRGFVHALAGVVIPDGARVVAMRGRSTVTQRGYSSRFETPVVNSEYKFLSLPATSYSLTIVGPNDESLYVCGVDAQGQLVREASKEWVVPCTAAVVAGAVTDCDLTIAASGCVHGVIRDGAGGPLVGAVVHCQRLLKSGRVWQQGLIRGAPVESLATRARGYLHPLHERSVVSDASGRYRIVGVLPGLYRLTVELEGRARRQERVVSFVGGEPLSRDFVLPVAGAVEGVLGHEAIVVLWSEQPEQTWAQRTDADGVFRFASVEPGHLQVGVVETGVLNQHQLTMIDVPPVLVRVSVEPGRTAFVDLRQVLPVTIAGRLKGGVRDAVLTLDGNRVGVGADGLFEFRFASPLSGTQRILITMDGVTTGVILPPAASGVQAWRGDIRDDRGATQLIALANGLPIDAKVRFSGHAIGAIDLRAADGALLVSLPVRGVTAVVEFANGAVVKQAVEGGGRIEFVSPVCGEIKVLALDAQGRVLHRQPIRAATWVHGTPPNADWGPYDEGAKMVVVEGVTDATGRVTLRGVRAGDVLVHFESSFGFGPGGSLLQERVQLDPGATVELRMQRK